LFLSLVEEAVMDELPESMRKRHRRQSVFQGSAREVSEDGDFVTLRQVRKVGKLSILDFLLLNFRILSGAIKKL